MARFFILFQTEKSSREVVISQGVLPLHSAVRFGFVVEFPDLQRCERRQLDVHDARHDMLVDVIFVIRRRRRADGWLCEVLIPP